MPNPTRTRWLAGLLALVVGVAGAAVWLILDWMGPENVPFIGETLENNLPLLLLIVAGVLVLAWLGLGTLGRRAEREAAETEIRPVQPQQRRLLLDDLADRYRDQLDSRLRHAGIEVHLPVGVEWRADHLLQPRLREEGAGDAEPTVSVAAHHDRARGRLLILGAPGAGKTTFLYGLALDLVEAALADPALRIPLVVNLASWGDEPGPLADWLEERLTVVAGINDRSFARSLVRTRQLHLLLDGLDEVAEAQRGPCIEAINAYLGEQPERLTVCSRRAEYDAVDPTLDLTAVHVLPLDVDRVIENLGPVPEAVEVREALRTDAALREIATTPLVLSVVLSTYLGGAVPDFARMDSNVRMGRLWDDYIVEMLRRRLDAGDSRFARFTPEKILTWLAWLARKMQGDDDTDFLLDRMPPDWLSDDQLFRRSTQLVFAFLWVILYSALGLVLNNILLGIIIGIVIAQLNDLGLSRNGGHDSIRLAEEIVWSWAAVREGIRINWAKLMAVGLVFGMLIGILLSMATGLFVGLVAGMAASLVTVLGAFMVMRGFIVSELRNAHKPGVRAYGGILNGFNYGLIYGLIFELVFGLVGWLAYGIAFGLAVGLLSMCGGLLTGLLDVGGGGLRHFLLRGLLAREGVFPWRAVGFLLFASDLVLLRRNRDLVEFRHLTLRDHLASAAMTPDHIARLARRARERA